MFGGLEAKSGCRVRWKKCCEGDGQQRGHFHMLRSKPKGSRIKMLLGVEFQSTILLERKWCTRVVGLVAGPESGRQQDWNAGGLGGAEG